MTRAVTAPPRARTRERLRTAAAAAVIIGLDSHTGLQTARILARRGVPVIGIAGDPRHPCCRTRVCHKIIITDITSRALIDILRRLAATLSEGAVLFPCTDLSVLMLSRSRAELSDAFQLILPEAHVIELLVDKGLFAVWAEQQGLPIPQTRLLHTVADVDRAISVLRFPCLLKPSVRTAQWKRHTQEKGFHVGDATALRTLFERCRAWTESLVVQEFVVGDDTSHFTCNCYFTRDGAAAAAFTSRKLRQWPPTAGEGCLSEEIRNDEVRNATLRLFQRANHRGLGYVEFKRDQRTGEYLILEPNVGRPTGRSAQAEAAGVELVYTQYCDALGLPLPHSREQRYRGVKWLHIRRDLQAAFYHWRRGELTLAQWACSWRGRKCHALFSWADPIPFWADLAAAACKMFAPGRIQLMARYASEKET